MPHCLQLMLILNMGRSLSTFLRQDPRKGLILLLRLLQLLLQIGRNVGSIPQLACMYNSTLSAFGYSANRPLC